LDEVFSLPKGWFAAVLADVGSLQVGYAYKSKWYSKEGVRLLRGANIAPGQVTWDDEVRLPAKLAADYSEYALDDGDIVIAMDRPIISTGLKVARITQADVGSLLVQRVARYVSSEFADGNFVWHLINSQFFIDHAISQSTGTDLPHISSNDILTTPVPLPALAEQREIARCVKTALAWIARLSAEATNARELIDHLDQAILAKAFQGELVPQDPSDEPASVLLERIRAECATAPAAIRRGSGSATKPGRAKGLNTKQRRRARSVVI
jgi:type I restriction enzyme S subunit